MISSNYFATEPGQLLFGAHRYLTAARLLRFSDTWEADAVSIQTPTLHLLAHGTELLLKFRLLEQGRSQASVAKEFGHDLALLWAADANADVRELVLECAETAWRTASGSGQYQDDFSGNPRCVLTKALQSLSMLHSRETNFALRYTCPPNTRAPRPAFLIDAFGEAAHHLVDQRGLEAKGGGDQRSERVGKSKRALAVIGPGQPRGPRRDARKPPRSRGRAVSV